MARASGCFQVTNATRRVLNPALALALRRMRLDSTNPLHGPGYSQRVLQVPGGPTSSSEREATGTLKTCHQMRSPR
ncbi:MAG: hypothetical protein R3C32_07500 [Chloroflexota bacterium]